MSSYFSEGEKKNSNDINKDSISDKSFCEKQKIYSN